MIARLYLVASMFFALNLAQTLGLPFANVFEKGLYLLLAAAVLLRRRMDPVAIALMVATLLLLIVLGALTSFPKFSWVTWLLSLNQFVIIYVLIGFYPSEHDAETILRASAWLPVACVAAGVIGLVATGHRMVGAEWATGTPRLQGSLIPAFLSGLSATGVVANLILGLEWRRLRYLALVAIDLVILILAGGRAALAVAAIVSVALVACSRAIHVRDKLVLLMGGIVVLPVFAAIAIPFALRRLITSTDNGRNQMAAYLQTLIDRHPWAGIGFGHQYWQTPQDIVVAVGSAAAHNDFLRLTVELGAIGAALFYLSMTVAMLRAAARGPAFNVTASAAWIGFLLLSHSDNALATPAYFPLLIVCVLPVPDLAGAKPSRRAMLPAVRPTPFAAVAGRG
ncbi:O-antigen ligase family protein [Sphingomonas sp. Mn802worker]|uniref:O-antigen ligase family protein n=1 Tax=Sphingomonas sp. Mn802worker TaxID=629773 RepID=UPI00035C3D08|nr:O-antigen ligase family protein [Sphingomonas sp. Mn802worker]